jgi:hypothetical protein
MRLKREKVSIPGADFRRGWATKTSSGLAELKPGEKNEGRQKSQNRYIGRIA